MKRAQPEATPLCPEVYAELDKHLADIDMKRLPQQLRGLRGLFGTFALLLKKDASELQKEVEQKLKQMLPEANSFEFEDYVAMIANCNQVAIIIHSLARGAYETLPFADAPEAGRPGPMTSLHVALCPTGTEYYAHPVVPDKGKERADLPSASLSDTGEEEEELQGEEEFEPYQLVKDNLGYRSPLPKRFLAPLPLMDIEDLDASNISPQEEEEELHGWQLGYEAKEKVAQLAKRVRAEPDCNLSFQEYQQCVSSLAARNVKIQDHFHQVLLSIIKGSDMMLLSELLRSYLQQSTACPEHYSNVVRYTENMISKTPSLQIATILALGTIVARDYFLRKADAGLTCAVGGFVQYGKTSNMLCVAAILADHGFTKIIMTSGKTIVLRNQSAKRGHNAFKTPSDKTLKAFGQEGTYEILSEEASYAEEDREEEEEEEETEDEEQPTVISGPRTPLYPPPTPESHEGAIVDVDPVADEQQAVDSLGWNVLKLLQLPGHENHVKQDMGKRALKKLLNDYDEEKIYFFVIKKNPQVINNMSQFLKKSTAPNKIDKIAWFDDEADETVNSKGAGKNWTNLHSSCVKLLNRCKKSGEAAYFGYTATLAACLLQDRESIFYPKAISYMFLSQPSYLGIEHFISPEWLPARFTLSNEDMIDFVVQESPSGKAKPTLIPFSNRISLLTFTIRTRNMPTTVLEHITKEHIAGNNICSAKKLWRNWYSYALQKLRELAPLNPRVIPEEALRQPGKDAPPPKRVVFAVESIRVSEMHYQKQMWNEESPPAWLLYFVCRSLLCWQIYTLRLDGAHLQRSNNLLQLLQAQPHTSREDLLAMLDFAAVIRSQELVKHLSVLAYDWPIDLKDQDTQQKLFQWHEQDTKKSHAVIEFLAELFQVRIQIVSAQEELVYTSVNPGYRDGPTIGICCGQTEYSVYSGTARSARSTELPHLTAFAHVSSRTLPHRSVVALIFAMLDVMRGPRFWECVFTKDRYSKWATQLRKAHQDITNLVNAYKEKELELELPTREDHLRRPPVPPLEELTPGIKAMLAAKDEQGQDLCDVRVKMSISLTHPHQPSQKLNLKDLNASPDNQLPKRMFIVGGNSFARGTTLSDPLVTVFTRFADNQEDLTQYMRMLGHRKPEAIDLMCAVGGHLQEVQFSKLWSTMAKNIVLQIDAWVNHSGEVDTTDAHGWLQTPGMRVAPRQHMHYADVRPTRVQLGKIRIINPPLHGDKCFQLFHLTNQLFAHLMAQYASCIHMPGDPVKKYPSYEQYPNAYCYSSPGIVFRDVLVDDKFLEFFRQQKAVFPEGENSATSFSSLLSALEALASVHISICFAHKKTNVEPLRKHYTEKYRAAVKTATKPAVNILDFVMPLRTQRKEPPYNSFSRQDFSAKVSNRVDAVQLQPKKGRTGREQFEVIPEFQHYVMIKDNKLKRSSAAPPLLIVALLDPQFKNRQRGGGAILHKGTDCADYPPTAYIFYPQQKSSQPVFSFAHPAPDAKRGRPE